MVDFFDLRVILMLYHHKIFSSNGGTEQYNVKFLNLIFSHLSFICIITSEYYKYEDTIVSTIAI